MSYENYSAKGLVVEFGQLSSKRTEVINEHFRLKKLTFAELTKQEARKSFLKRARQEMAEAEEQWNICRDEILRRLEWFDNNQIKPPEKRVLQ